MAFETDQISKDNSGDEIKAIISKYKESIAQSKLTNELYKWRNIQKFIGRPDVDALDFAKEITDLKFDNLVFNTPPQIYKLLRSTIRKDCVSFLRSYSMRTWH